MNTLPLDDLDSSRRKLLQRARESRKDAYCPYSSYSVGAIISTHDSEVFTGHNIEFVTYTNTLHAEQAALAEAVKNGYRQPDDFELLVVSSGNRERDRPAGDPPCGICLQSLVEFCPPDLTVLVDSGDTVKQYSLEELLPEGMQDSSLDT